MGRPREFETTEALDKATLVYHQTGDSSGIANTYSNKGFLLLR